MIKPIITLDVKPKIPARLTPLNELAYNLWFSWNHGVTEVDDSLSGCSLIVLVKGYLLCDYLKAFEQVSGLSRILAGDVVGLPQRFEGSFAYVCEISYRCCNEIEHSRFRGSYGFIWPSS